jgi:ubiquitin-conjugating enzyme E2 D/E
MEKDPPISCSMGPLGEDNMHRWQAVIMGPPNSPYARGMFQVIIQVPLGYPYKLMKARFRTKVFHPNINCNGLGHLEDEWSPTMTIAKQPFF